MKTNDAIRYLEDKIRSYERSIGRVNAQIDVLKGELSRTEALLNSARTLLKDELAKSGKSIPEPPGSESLAQRLAVLSLSDAITEIVSSSPTPIHADQVLKKLRESGRTPGAKNPKNSVVSMLHRGVRLGLYKKVGPNVFARVTKLEEAP